jgi:hypothetical protein
MKIISCEGCAHWRQKATWSDRFEVIKNGVHRALVVGGSLSNAQQRTLGFETSFDFGSRSENACDISINIGKKALLSFLYDEDRPMLALDTWLGRDDSARVATQMTTHHYDFNVLAIDAATDKEIQRRGNEKLYGLPLYIIENGSLSLREYDPDGSVVLFDIARVN